MGERPEQDGPRERFEQRVSGARDAAAQRVSDARDAAVERRDAAVEAGREAIAKVKPRLRGVSHEWAFFLSLGLGGALVAAADGTKATVAAVIYAVTLSALFGVSALYHRIDWRRPEIRRWMRRLDHTMIFMLIAGTITPFALLLLEGTFAKALLITVWAAALAGIVVELIWIEAPKWVTAIVYSAVGLIGAVAYPEIVSKAGLGAALLIAGGGALYLTGALVYAVERPDPSPRVFGYHEIFHVLVIAAAAAHFAAIALYALPAG